MNPILFFIIVGLSIISYFLYKDYKGKERNLIIQTQDVEESINLTQEELRHQDALGFAYKARSERYASLEYILDELNSTLVLGDIAEYLVKEILKVVAQSEGNVVIYLLNKHNQKLEILKSRRQPPKTTIEIKEGDVFDYWVLKQSQPLLVEEAKTDFRFDLERVDNELTRRIESLISVPVISEQNFLGILRVDRDTRRVFSAEDLRLLSAIGDIASVAMENAILYQKTEELAIIDSLTRLYQRKYFLERLDKELLCAQNKAKPLSLVMLDIDYFKNYNDQFGHTAGDMVLQRVASVLRDFIDPAKSLCCRFGGEEFILYLINNTQEGVNAAAELLRKRIEEEKIILRRQQTSVTVSIGIAHFPEDATDREDLVRIVDERMYKAKTLGRNQICFT